MRGIRGRLAVALVALVAATVLVIGVGTYAFVDARLRDSLLADAARQAQFNLSVLVPGALHAGATSRDFAAAGLPGAFRLRGDVEEIADFGGGDVYDSTVSLAGAEAGFPPALTAGVAAGQLAYAWLPVGGSPSLVVAGRASLDGGPGPSIYFVFPAAGLEDALGQLRLALLAAGIGALVVALATAGLVARGLLRPLRSGSVAAARIAGGDLAARVPVAGADELAAWAAGFNRMADSLAATIERLEASEDRNRRFVAEVSHELRTPLTALLGEAALIEAAADRLPGDLRRPAELLVGDVRRLRVLVEDLMELSRFDANAETAELAQVDLGAAVRSIVSARLPSAHVEVPAEPLVIESDVRRLDRILGNLLDNARIHAPGAPVDVSLSRSAEGTAVVTVADRGPGVAPEALARLFDRFYKADPSRRSGSSGMGLAIAAEHAALLGGRLEAAARPGGGLVFSLTLPVTKPLPVGDGVEMPARDASIVPGDPRPASTEVNR